MAMGRRRHASDARGMDRTRVVRCRCRLLLVGESVGIVDFILFFHVMMMGRYIIDGHAAPAGSIRSIILIVPGLIISLNGTPVT